MFDFGIGTSEIMLIAIVALIVIGPKDLPQLLRTLAQFTRKIRGMAREFQSHVDDMMRESGVDEVRKEVAKATDFARADLDFKKEEADLKKAFESAAPKPEEIKPEPPKPAIAAPQPKANGEASEGVPVMKSEEEPVKALSHPAPRAAEKTVEPVGS